MSSEIDPYDGDMPDDDEFVDILSGSSSVTAEVTAFRRLAATIGVEQAYRKWRKLQQRARAEDEQPQDERDGALADLATELDAANDDADQIAAQRSDYRQQIRWLRTRVRELEAERDQLRPEYGIRADFIDTTSAEFTVAETLDEALEALAEFDAKYAGKVVSRELVQRPVGEWRKVGDHA